MNIDELLARTEILDVLHRYCRAVDRGDIEGLRAVYHDGATDLHGGFDGTGYDFAPYIVEKMDAAVLLGQHHITNAIIEFDGDEARVESYFLAAQPYTNAAGDRLLCWAGGRYLDHFAKRDGRWAIAARKVVMDWTRAEIPGDPWPGEVLYPVAARRDADPSSGFFTQLS